MSEIFSSNEVQQLRQYIASQCEWSDTHSSLKHVLKRTVNQLPLLISFATDKNDQQAIVDKKNPPIFFFDRDLSNKLSFTPLLQREDRPEQFDVYPSHCTFIMTDFFKGLFEFVLNGQRCGRIYKNLEQLTTFASNSQSPIVFMSRDRALAFLQYANTTQWANKEYPQGAIFRAECIHRSSTVSNDGQQIPNDYLECSDEDGYNVFIKMDQPGRYSLIATSPEQQDNEPEIYVHSTQTANIDQLINRITLVDGHRMRNNCIRLVRGPVPHNFFCQYFQFTRQHKHDVLVGLTQEGLLVEYNLDGHVPCRYATNLNEVLENLYNTRAKTTLESYTDRARTHYRENFQYNMQLTSSIDWTAFYHYWKWTGDLHRNDIDKERYATNQSRHRFQLIASIQDLSDHARKLASAFRKFRSSGDQSPSNISASPIRTKKTFSDKQRLFLSQMSKLISTPTNPKRHHSVRFSQPLTQTSALLLANDVRPFDDSVYESNPMHQPPPRAVQSDRPVRKHTHK